MYNTEHRVCPVHPTVIIPCGVCGTPREQVNLLWTGVGDSNWTTGGTPSRVAGAFTCRDGVTLDLIIDADPTALAYYARQIQWATSGRKVITFRIAKSSSYATHLVEVIDIDTGGTGLLVALINFTGAVPIVTMTAGALLLLANNGDGSFTLTCSLDVVAGHYTPCVVIPAGALIGDLASFYVGQIDTTDIQSSGILATADINGVNYASQSVTPYNTLQPRSRRHDPFANLADRLGLNETLDDPREKIPPPPLPLSSL